ncbi:TonB-dependent receptor [Pseudoduganella sp. UC29_106]|uniref:TonB-dependent receptor n=1 Tax=Pseudoduganella sp. UC29_106 TaxID=3374553 RepID=UPI0037576CA9
MIALANLGLVSALPAAKAVDTDPPAAVEAGSAATAAAPVAAAAAPAAEETGQVVSAAPSEDSQKVVISARRRSERMIDVPVAATAVNAADIRQYDLTQVANIKLVAPQITFDRGFTGGGASISMRGVSSSSLDAGLEQSVLLDFDGMAISRGRVLNDAMFDIDEIDVLKGPQTLYFGKNSPGGVVSVKSASPTRKLSGYARLGYETTSDMPSVEAAVSGPISESTGFRVALLSSKSKGYIENQDKVGVPDLVRTAASGSTFVPAAPSRLGAEEKLATRISLSYENDDNFDASFKLLLSRYRGQGLQSFSEVMGCPAGVTKPRILGITDPNGDCTLNNKSSQGWLSSTIINAWPEVKTNGGGEPYSKNDTILPTLTMNYKLGDIKLTSVTGYYDYDYVSQGNADATSYSYYWSYSNEKNKSFYQELRAVSSYQGMLNFSAGGHYENNRRTLYVGGVNGPVPRDAATGRYENYDNQQHNRSHAFSVFGQVSVNFRKDLELSAGGRYTQETKKLSSSNVYVNPNTAGFLPQGVLIEGEKTEHNFSPEATLTWHPTADTMLYGAYKTGFLSGGYSNPGTLSPVTSIKSLSFSAEKVKGFELGGKATLLNHKLTGSVTAYRYEYTGLPLTSLIALDATRVTFVTQNAATTIARGVELEGTYRPVKGLMLRGSASYNDAYFSDFAKAQCYTGQTAALGCIADPVTKASTQDLSGKVVYRSPKWLLTAGAAYEWLATPDLRVNVNADARRSTAYYAGLNLNPTSYQPGYTTLNAGVRLTFNDKWSFAVIGRNLTNRIYATLAVDKPGGAGEAFAVAGEPRMVVIQVEGKF